MRRIRRWVAALGVGTLAAGCGSDSPSAPATTTTDIYAIIAHMSSGVGGIAGASSASGVVSVPTTTIVPGACVYSAATGGFSCPPVTIGGITSHISYWLYDAAGRSQTTPDPATTASVRTVTDFAGTPVAGTTIASHIDETMSGLLTGARVLNGAATDRDSTTVAAPPGDRVSNDTITIVNLVEPTAGANGAFGSGTVTIDATQTENFGSGPFTLPMHIVMVYHGTSVTATTTEDGEVTTCVVDLSGKTATVCTTTGGF